jgi:hypothetical protein
MPKRLRILPAALTLIRSARPLLFTLCITGTLACFCASARAEVQIVLSQGEFRMGDRDTKEDAVRLATEAAKRNALEQVATYLESVTVVEGVDVTKDEIRTYTAGLVLVLEQQTTLSIDGDTVVVDVDLTSQIDTEEVAQAILAFRDNEDARRQLAALKSEIDDLHKELEVATRSLAAATTPEQVQQVSLQRQDILNRVQSDGMVSQAWTDWVIVGPLMYPMPWLGMPHPQALLSTAQHLYPASPHVPIAQRVIVPTPTPAAMQPAPQQPGARPVPLTLNEISHATPTMPVHLGNPSSGANQTHLEPTAPVPTASRSLMDIRRLNALRSAASSGAHAAGQPAAPSDSQSMRTLQQFLQPPAAALQPPRASSGPPGTSRGSRSIESRQQSFQADVVPPAARPPVTRRVPSNNNQIPAPLVAPRVPYHITPRGLGGIGTHGSWHGGGTGGGRTGGARGGRGR